MEILINTHVHDVEINITTILFRRFFQVILIFWAITINKNVKIKSDVLIRFQD